MTPHYAARLGMAALACFASTFTVQAASADASDQPNAHSPANPLPKAFVDAPANSAANTSLYALADSSANVSANASANASANTSTNASTPALAAAPDKPNTANAQSLPLWEFGLGLGGLNLPMYKGSAYRTRYLAPLPYFIYRGDTFYANRDGMGYKLWGVQDWRLDASFGAALPAKSAGTARDGMNNLPFVGEVGVMLKRDYEDSNGMQWSWRLPVRHGSGLSHSGVSNVGWISDPNVRVFGRLPFLGAHWDWGSSLGLNFQNAQYNQFYYGVGQRDATPARAAYNAKGGYSGMDLRGGVYHRFGDFVLSGFVGASNIKGAAFEHSPLVQRTTNLYGGFALFWIFQKSQESSRLPASMEMQ